MVVTVKDPAILPSEYVNASETSMERKNLPVQIAPNESARSDIKYFWWLLSCNIWKLGALPGRTKLLVAEMMHIRGVSAPTAAFVIEKQGSNLSN